VYLARTYLRRCKKSFAVSVADQPPKSHSFECRPRHGSLPPVLLLSVDWRLGLDGVIGEVAEFWRACWGCVVGVLVMCLGGDTIGDFERLRDASRERLLERPRTRAVMAPKNSDAARDVGDVGDAGDIGGDIWSDDCEFCDPAVFVRTGGIDWKLD
jgi:hypothetical protein